jgi:hypothetical protein
MKIREAIQEAVGESRTRYPRATVSSEGYLALIGKALARRCPADYGLRHPSIVSIVRIRSTLSPYSEELPVQSYYLGFKHGGCVLLGERRLQIHSAEAIQAKCERKRLRTDSTVLKLGGSLEDRFRDNCRRDALQCLEVGGSEHLTDIAKTSNRDFITNIRHHLRRQRAMTYIRPYISQDGIGQYHHDIQHTANTLARCHPTR